MWKIIGGVIVGVISSLLNALGYITQKKAHLLNAHSTRPIYKHPVWLLGFGLLVIAAIISLGRIHSCILSHNGIPRPDHTIFSLQRHHRLLHSLFYAIAQRAFQSLGPTATRPHAHWRFTYARLLQQGREGVYPRCKECWWNRTCSSFTSDPLQLFFSSPTPACSSSSLSTLWCESLTHSRITKSILKLKQIYDASMEHLESDSAGSESFEMELTVFQGTT